MNSEQAAFLRDFFIPAIRREQQVNRQVINAMPNMNLDYKPDSKSRSAFELAWHVASGDVWFFNGVAQGVFKSGDHSTPPEVRTPQQICSWYETHIEPCTAKIAALSGEELAAEVDFFGVLKQPRVSFMLLALNHTVHHRGQLSTYLRAMGGKVPSIYGDSADSR